MFFLVFSYSSCFFLIKTKHSRTNQHVFAPLIRSFKDKDRHLLAALHRYDTDPNCLGRSWAEEETDRSPFALVWYEEKGLIYCRSSCYLFFLKKNL